MANLDSYRDFVRSLADRGDNKLFLNSDIERAIIVLVEIINKATSEVRIFAGSLHSVEDNKDYIIAISEFVERGGTVKVLLNQYDEALAKQSNLYLRLAYYISLGKPVELKTTKERPYRSSDEDKKPVHFTVGDKTSYRVETDIEQRTAQCNFNDPKVASGIAEFFDKLFDSEDAQTIDLVSLFNGRNQ